jgi:hypothetical protein
MVVVCPPMDIPLDIDLGELIPGHHVVLTGIDLGETVDVPRFRAEIEAKVAERLAKMSRSEVPGGLGVSVSWRRLTPHDLEPVGTRKMEPSLHYKFIPGIEPSEEERDGAFFWYWMLSVSDDVGTHYRDDHGGTKEQAAGGAATTATRDIGGHIPAEASRLLLGFTPPGRWKPPEPWPRELQIDLMHRRVIDQPSGGSA